MTPRFVADILRSTWLWHLSRVLVTFMYWLQAVRFLMDFSEAQATMELTGFQPTWLVAALTIAVLLAASALIIFDRLVWLGAGMLAVFTVMTILLVHDFWNMSGLEATLTLLEDEEHLTVIGGLIIVAIHSFWRKERGQSQRL